MVEIPDGQPDLPVHLAAWRPTSSGPVPRSSESGGCQAPGAVRRQGLAQGPRHQPAEALQRAARRSRGSRRRARPRPRRSTRPAPLRRQLRERPQRPGSGIAVRLVDVAGAARGGGLPLPSRRAERAAATPRRRRRRRRSGRIFALAAEALKAYRVGRAGPAQCLGGIMQHEAGGHVALEQHANRLITVQVALHRPLESQVELERRGETRPAAFVPGALYTEVPRRPWSSSRRAFGRLPSACRRFCRRLQRRLESLRPEPRAESTFLPRLCPQKTDRVRPCGPPRGCAAQALQARVTKPQSPDSNSGCTSCLGARLSAAW